MSNEFMAIKVPAMLKGATFALLGLSATLLILAKAGNPVVVAAGAAALAGYIMIGNSVIETVEFFFMQPAAEHAKLITAFKVLSFLGSLAAAGLLLTDFVRYPDLAVSWAIALIILSAIADGFEAVLPDAPAATTAPPAAAPTTTVTSTP